MNPKIEQLRKLKDESLQGGGEARKEKLRKAGKMPARERIDLLLDKGFQ